MWTDSYDEARLRSLMSETPLSDHELTEVRRHYEIAVRERDRLASEVGELARERDRLLREWSPGEAS